MKRLLTIAAIGSCISFAQSGVLPFPKATKLIVVSCGPVRVVGEGRSDLSYNISGQRGQVQIIAKVADGDTQKFWLKAIAPDASAELDMRVPKSLSVVIDSTGGDLLTTDLDGDVMAKTGWGRIVLDRLSKGAVAKTGGGEVRVGRVGGELKCFSRAGSIFVDSGAGGYFETEGGEIIIRESTGPVVAKTAGGNIHVIRAAGGVEATTSGGVIDVQWADGPVVAKTGGGSIQVSAAKSVQCETGNGAIRLKNVGGKINATTASGTILAELAANSPPEESQLKSAAGDVIVLIPSNLSITVKAGGQKIISEFPSVRGAVLAFGEIRGGGPLLGIEAAGGTVFLRRRQ